MKVQAKLNVQILKSIPFSAQWRHSRSLKRFMCAISHRRAEDRPSRWSPPSSLFKVENRFNPSLELVDQRATIVLQFSCNSSSIVSFSSSHSILFLSLHHCCLPIFNFNRLNPIDFTFFGWMRLSQLTKQGLQSQQSQPHSQHKTLLLTPMQRASDQR